MSATRRNAMRRDATERTPHPQVLKISCATRKKLETFYQPMTEALIKLVGKEKGSFARITCQEDNEVCTGRTHRRSAWFRVGVGCDDHT